MATRRHFLHTASLATASLILGLPAVKSMAKENFTSRRPAPPDRNFTSEAVESTIRRVRKDIKNEEIAWLFENCFPNTLDTTVRTGTRAGKPDTFVITGDIDAMWLRDSSAQVWPYLPLAKQDKKLRTLLQGVIHRQAACILLDPYANAFYADATKVSEWKDDETTMKPGVHERKWEVDSLCYPIRLAYGYWKATGDTSPFDSEWQSAMQLVLQTFREQQRKTDRGPYKFGRRTSWQTDTLAGGGYGNPVRPVGLICSMFRPSDDATQYAFLIPSNLFAAVSLRQLAELFGQLKEAPAFAADCVALAQEVENAARQHAQTEHLRYGRVYAYEADGFGNQSFMDDANVPSLLALPYLGAVAASDPVYQATRRLVLSPDNPYFYRGKAAEGVGGPHVGAGQIWPLGIIMRALTSQDAAEIQQCLTWLRTTHAGTGFMHESFDQDNPSKFSRKWFAWANTLFGELILKVHANQPHLLQA
ncbi:glycoside hydrolase family 125 protein [Hymenobacter sp. BT491]|uniref:glycoside hydrolase family 125 protein n=1 Tax=Hymenobacter sp. BT491 TaxID=2766779 RepID=UPI001653ECC1|nr:glycoside hydrolase family 125 protein [Hymenobacter sp. BT491]MBC6990817.1 glycoside hydrolase family 125 protein [Hymenobacter sp. BT491]